jgi:low affinity Fe/Cu permease
LKLDELIRAVEGAHNVLMDIEQLSEDELEDMRERYEKLAAQARQALRRGAKDTGTPEVNL